MLTKVDLPEPDTPVTTISLPSGNSTLRFFRLFSSAPVMVIFFPLPLRLSNGTGTNFLPDKYCPVSDFGLASTSSGVPAAITSPP